MSINWSYLHVCVETLSKLWRRKKVFQIMFQLCFNWRGLEINTCYRFCRDFAANGRVISCLMLLSELHEQELRNSVISKNSEYFSSSPSTMLNLKESQPIWLSFDEIFCQSSCLLNIQNTCGTYVFMKYMFSLVTICML